jgi:hypothetical protein
MARDRRPFIDTLAVPPTVEMLLSETEPPAQTPPTELDVMVQLANQLQTLTDRLALQPAVEALMAQVSMLQSTVEQLMAVCLAPRIKEPVRDEAGRIIEVRERLG